MTVICLCMGQLSHDNHVIVMCLTTITCHHVIVMCVRQSCDHVIVR